MDQAVISGGSLSFFVGVLGFLQWAPVARKNFEKKIEQIVYEDLNNLARQGENIEFPVSGQEHGNWFGNGLVPSSGDTVTKVVLNIGQVTNDEWKNVRVLLLTRDDQIQGILHAKSGFLDSLKNGFFDLSLLGVDYESVAPNDSSRSSPNFVSFEKWKKPLRFKMRDQSAYTGSKYVSIVEYLMHTHQNERIRAEPKAILQQFNKYGSLAFSSVSLAPVLIFLE